MKLFYEHKYLRAIEKKYTSAEGNYSASELANHTEFLDRQPELKCIFVYSRIVYNTNPRTRNVPCRNYIRHAPTSIKK